MQQNRSLKEASQYAGSDGIIFRLPLDRFDEDSLAYNDLLAAALIEQDSSAVYEITDWRSSMEEFESVRYDATAQLGPDDVFSPSPTPQP